MFSRSYRVKAQSLLTSKTHARKSCSCVLEVNRRQCPSTGTWYMVLWPFCQNSRVATTLDILQIGRMLLYIYCITKRTVQNPCPTLNGSTYFRPDYLTSQRSGQAFCREDCHNIIVFFSVKIFISQVAQVIKIKVAQNIRIAGQLKSSLLLC